MFYNRTKDHFHFYSLGLVTYPCILIVIVTSIVFGHCELKDTPTEGPPPRYWQYESTPLRQFWAWAFGASDVERHERSLAFFEVHGILSRWRRLERRVKHLQGERWDYKGYYYMPVSAKWVDYSKYANERIYAQNENRLYSGS